MHWKTKAACFRLLGAIPFGGALHFWAQKNVTRTWPRPVEDINALVGVARKTVADFQRLSAKPLQKATFLEIGAGRDLAVPITLKILGAGSVNTIDIERLAKLDLVNAAAKMVAGALGVPAPQFASWRDLENFGIKYAAPFDAASAPLPAIDAFVSNEVLEHVPPSALRGIFDNVARSMPVGGVSLHSIDYSDHYARGGGVSRYHFLQFSEGEWHPYNSGMHYVNRLRHSQYVRVMMDAGFAVIDEDTYAEDLPTGMVIAPEFKNFDPADLRVMRARICAVKP